MIAPTTTTAKAAQTRGNFLTLVNANSSQVARSSYESRRPADANPITH